MFLRVQNVINLIVGAGERQLGPDRQIANRLVELIAQRLFDIDKPPLEVLELLVQVMLLIVVVLDRCGEVFDLCL